MEWCVFHQKNEPVKLPFFFYFSKWLTTIKRPQERAKINKLTSSRRKSSSTLKSCQAVSCVILCYSLARRSRASQLDWQNQEPKNGEKIQPCEWVRENRKKYENAGFVVWIEQVFPARSVRLQRDRLVIITPTSVRKKHGTATNNNNNNTGVVCEAWIHTEHCRMISKTWYIGSQIYFRFQRQSPIDRVQVDF